MDTETIIELSEDCIEDFQGILSILYRWQEKYVPGFLTSEQGIFYSKLIKAKPEDVSIEISEDDPAMKRYYIFATVGTENREWIHEDGIAAERVLLTSQGITDHPVFKITCLEDLIKRSLPVEVKING